MLVFHSKALSPQVGVPLLPLTHGQFEARYSIRLHSQPQRITTLIGRNQTMRLTTEAYACELIVQGSYPKAWRPGIEHATCLLQVQRLSTTIRHRTSEYLENIISLLLIFCDTRGPNLYH